MLPYKVSRYIGARTHLASLPGSKEVLLFVPLENDLLVLRSSPADRYINWEKVDTIKDAGVNISPLRELTEDMMTGVEPLHDVSLLSGRIWHSLTVYRG